MVLHGLGKLTLLDYPGYLACTAFTGACNFRCPFCHNAPLVLSPSLCEHITEEDFFNFLRSRKNRLEGVCITGGEPTLQPDLPDFLAKIKELGFRIKLDTNGYHPEVLATLLEQHLLDAVAMDIKNSKDAYAMTAGIPEAEFQTERIEESIRLLLTSCIPHEFRTTVVKELHNADRMASIGKWISSLSKETGANSPCLSPYFLQEFKASGSLICGETTLFSPHSAETMNCFVSLLQTHLPNTKLRGQ
ncbi:MAG: anaerobic ribonucleoside-triphosphate reductase activating protein [Lachnospiraceae bacterium]|nr:anaerobic ribonucleoside-triphosphate reductase activating protein [Lachnospiraceae bacterium]